MRIHWLQHVPFEGLGAIEAWARSQGHTLAATRLWMGEPLVPAASCDGLVVMGGPMSVHDEREHPWLVAEKAFIAETVDAGRPVLGVCLGAQLIADVLGARVRANAFKEIGWFPVRLTPEAQTLPLFDGLPDQFEAFHWHGETFDLPRGATRIASSQACTDQGFVYGSRVLALQFHLETTGDGVEKLVESCPQDLAPGPFVEPAATMIDLDAALARAHALLGTILDRLFF